jgi:hypothetical protein
MATNSKKPVYFPVSKPGVATAGSFLKLQLDPDFYSVPVLAKIGAFNSQPDDTKPNIPINIRYAKASGCVSEKKLKITSGAEPNIKTRNITILVAREFLDTVNSLVGDTVQIGRGAVTKPWKVESVS